MMTSAYRPRNPGHDYYGRGTYLITLVVSGRERVLSNFSDNKDGEDLTNRKTLVLTHLGEVVANTWLRTPEAQAVHGNRVRVHAYVCMPDHFHGVIEVLEPMAWSLGDIIQAFKSVCTSHWQRQQGLAFSEIYFCCAGLEKSRCNVIGSIPLPDSHTKKQSTTPMSGDSGKLL